jgi:hypothetical protein
VSILYHTDVRLTHWFVDAHDCGYYLSTPFIVSVDEVEYSAPAGMKTDGASIPRFFWRLIGDPMNPQFIRAAVIHDAACERCLYGFDGSSRDAADLFGALLRDAGVSGWKVASMVTVVKRFGPQWKF